MKLRRGQPGHLHESARMVWGGSALLLVVARLYPFNRFPLVTCPLKAMTHIPCPTCGMTRAFVRFTHGDWAGAVHVSPLGAALAATAMAIVIYGLLRLTVLRRGVAVELTAGETKAWRISAIGALLVNWVYLIASGSAA